MHKIGADGWTSDDNLKWRREYAPPILNALKTKLEGITGIPTVRYLAGELFLSPNYFVDLVRVKTGESATQFIRHFVMQKAKSLLLAGRCVSEVSDALGFEYPQNLTRMFKKEFGVAPSQIGKR